MAPQAPHIFQLTIGQNNEQISGGLQKTIDDSFSIETAIEPNPIRTNSTTIGFLIMQKQTAAEANGEQMNFDEFFHHPIKHDIINNNRKTTTKPAMKHFSSN